jgi:DNA-binding transcriptional LysR family regulator
VRPREQAADAAFVWLPTGDPVIETEVLAVERLFVALSVAHPLAGRSSVSFAEIADEPITALPAAAGAARDFWLAGAARDFWLAASAREGVPARVAAEVSSADEVFEVVSSGAAITLLAEGNALIYARPGIVCVPVGDLAPARLAIAWRRGDRRLAVRDVVRACRDLKAV